MVPKNFSAGLVAALIVVTPMPSFAMAQDAVAEEQSGDRFLLPSFAVGPYYKDAFLARGDRSREEIAAPYLNAVTRENLSEYERFALGQLLYNTMQANPVVEIMKDYMDSDDWVARHAYRVMMQTQFVALENIEVVVNEYYPEFLRRFGASSPHDVRGLDAAVRNIAGLHDENGDTDKAIELMEEEIHRIGFKAPHRSFYLPFWHREIFKNAGRTADAIELMEFAKAGLEEELAARLERGSTVEEEAGPMMPISMRRWFWVLQGVGDDPSVFEGRNRQFREMIAALGRGIEAAQKSNER